MAAIQGRKVLIKVGVADSEVLLAGTLTHSFKVSQTLTDATTKDSTGGWAESLPVEREGSFSVQGVYDPDAASGGGALDMFTLLANGTKTHCVFGPTESGDDIFTCDAYVRDLSMDAPQKDRTTYTVELQVTGAITKTTVA